MELCRGGTVCLKLDSIGILPGGGRADGEASVNMRESNGIIRPRFTPGASNVSRSLPCGCSMDKHTDECHSGLQAVKILATRPLEFENYPPISIIGRFFMFSNCPMPACLSFFLLTAMPMISRRPLSRSP